MTGEASEPSAWSPLIAMLMRSRSRSAPNCVPRSEEHTSELQSRRDLVCRLLLEKKKKKKEKKIKRNKSQIRKTRVIHIKLLSDSPSLLTLALHQSERHVSDKICTSRKLNVSSRV